MLLLAFASAAEVGRSYEFSVDLDVIPEPERIEFHQKDALTVDLSVYRDGDPVDLSGSGFIILFELMRRSDDFSTAIYTGTIVSAASGSLRFSASPQQTNIDAGFYDGFITIAKESQGYIFDMGVAQENKVYVMESYP